MKAPSRLRALAAVAALVVGSGLAACEAQDESARTATPDSAAADDVATGQAPIKACDVITEAELESILGIELEAARTTNDYAGDSQCRWDLPGDGERGVSISIHEHGDLDNYRRVPGAEPVAGLADEALWNGAYGQLALLDGERVISIGLLLDQPERADAVRIARAMRAAPR